MAIWVSLLIAILGCLVYALSNNPKVAEMGRLAWLAGLIGFCVQVGGHSISLLR